MTTRDDILRDIARRMHQHRLSLADVERALTETPAAPPEQTAGPGALMKSLAFLGGLLIFGGLGFLVSLIWDDLGPAGRVAILFGPGLAVYLVGLILARHDVDRDALAAAITPLLLIGSWLQAAGIVTAFAELQPDADTARSLLIMGLAMMGQQAMVLRVSGRTALAFNTLFYLAISLLAALDLSGLRFRDGTTGILFGLMLFLAALAIGRTRHREAAGFWYLVAALAFIAGLWDELRDVDLPRIGLLLVCSVAMIQVSAWLKSRCLLLAGCIALLATLGDLTATYFADSRLWPLMLIASGFALIGLSVYGVKLSRSWRRAPADE